MNYSNESRNSLASERILNCLNNSWQEALQLVAAIILTVFLDVKYFSAVYLSPKNYSIWHDGMKVSKVN
jgi:hypothetical protein